jgi:hypothetical protein
VNGAPRDWVAWHARYDEGGSLRRRLEIVQRHLVAALESQRRTPIRVISMCAGQARDLIGALGQTGRRDIVGRLIELHPDLAEDARTGLRSLGIAEVEVVTGDAGGLSAYEGAAPADVVLACGVFGNVSDADVETTIRSMPSLCARDATLIWTRHRRPPDLTAEIRRWLYESGFENVAFEPVDDPGTPGAVGVARFRGATLPLNSRRLFTFEQSA